MSGVTAAADSRPPVAPERLLSHHEYAPGCWAWSETSLDPGEPDWDDPCLVSPGALSHMAREPDAIETGWWPGDAGSWQVADVAFPTRERALEALAAAGGRDRGFRSLAELARSRVRPNRRTGALDGLNQPPMSPVPTSGGGDG